MDSKTLKAMTWQEFAGLFEVGLGEVDDDMASVAMYYFDYTDGKEIEVSVPIFFCSFLIDCSFPILLNKHVRDLCDRDIWNDQALFEELKEKAIEAHEEWERSNQC
jgi:hypothetical protein